mmetsp:Transcript_4753/g.17969  ORF Transcript_4753/g.17969 Transcript_4753/m.17969 type:complete len:462 (-) Transcript_4753:65-1450(-)
MAQPRGRMPRLDLGQYELAFKMLVTPNAAGKIIGKGGSVISAIKQEAGINCQILGPEHLFPRTGCQVAVLLGSRSGIEAALAPIFEKVVEAEGDSFQGGAFTAALVMSKNAVSMVIGSKGATIASLRQETGCQILADKEVFFGEQVVRVTGTLECILVALVALTPFVERSNDSLQLAMQEYGALGGDWSMPAPAARGAAPSSAALLTPQRSSAAPLGARASSSSWAGAASGGDWAAPSWTGGSSGKGKGGAFASTGFQARQAPAPAPRSLGKGKSGGVSESWRQPATSRPAQGGALLRPQGSSSAPIGGRQAPAKRSFAEVELEAAEPDEEEAFDEVQEAFLAEGSGEAPPEEGGAEDRDGGFEEALADARPAEEAPSAEGAEQDPEVLNSHATIVFPIPADRIGRVLGKGGGVSREIRRLTGVKLTIDPGPSEGMVTLAGALSQVHRAHCMVVARVMADY